SELRELPLSDDLRRLEPMAARKSGETIRRCRQQDVYPGFISRSTSYNGAEPESCAFSRKGLFARLPMRFRAKLAVTRPEPIVTTVSRIYSSDFLSDLFTGDLLLSKKTSSFAQPGTPPLPSRITSFALSFLPYSFSFALPSERRVEPSRETPAKRPL